MERNIFVEAMKAKMIATSVSAQEILRIRRDLIAQEVLGGYPQDTVISKELYDQDDLLSECLNVMNQCFEFPNWEGQTIGRFLTKCGISGEPVCLNVIQYSSHHFNPDGVKAVNITLQELWDAKPNGDGWSLLSGLDLVFDPGNKCMQSLPQVFRLRSDTPNEVLEMLLFEGEPQGRPRGELEARFATVSHIPYIRKWLGVVLDHRYADSIIGTGHDNYDAIEIHGVRDLHEPDDPAGTCCEVDDATPQFYSVYVHLKGGGIESVGDHGSADLARQYAEHIAGRYGWRVHDYLH